MRQSKFCTGCNKSHSIQVDGYTQWHSQIIEGTKRYYCNKHVFCVGCNSIHSRTAYMKHATRIHPETGKRTEGWWCDVWVKPPAMSMKRKIDSLSPQEVVSGVHLGADRQELWGPDSADFSVERAEQLKDLGEAISD